MATAWDSTGGGARPPPLHQNPSEPQLPAATPMANPHLGLGLALSPTVDPSATPMANTFIMVKELVIVTVVEVIMIEELVIVAVVIVVVAVVVIIVAVVVFVAAVVIVVADVVIVIVVVVIVVAAMVVVVVGCLARGWWASATIGGIPRGGQSKKKERRGGRRKIRAKLLKGQMIHGSVKDGANNQLKSTIGQMR